MKQRNKNDNTGSEIWVECRQTYRINFLWECDTVAAWETLDTQPQDFSKGNLIDTNEESGCDEKNEYVRKEGSLAKHSWRYFTTLKAKRINISNDRVLERSMTLHQKIEKIPILLGHKMRKKDKSIVQTTTL